MYQGAVLKAKIFKGLLGFDIMDFDSMYLIICLFFTYVLFKDAFSISFDSCFSEKVVRELWQP